MRAFLCALAHAAGISTSQCAVKPHAHAVPPISVYRLSYGWPMGLIATRDGGAFAYDYGDTPGTVPVAHVDSEGRLVETRLRGDDQIDAIAEAPDGKFFGTAVLERSKATSGNFTFRTAIVRFSASDVSIVRLLPADAGSADALAVGSDGRIWIAIGGERGDLPEDPLLHVVTPSNLCNPDSFAFDAHETLFAAASGSACLDRIVNKRAEALPVGSFAAQLGQVTAGPSGEIWFIERDRHIGHVLADGKVVEYALPRGPELDDRLAVDRHSVWFASGSELGRFSIAHHTTTFYHLPGSLSYVTGLSVNKAGTLWLGGFVGGPCHHRCGAIVRLQPEPLE